MTEEENRSVKDSFGTPQKSYHYQDYAWYQWWEYSVQSCIPKACSPPWYEWHPHMYLGPACDPDGGNPSGSPCGQHAYTQPAFHTDFARQINSPQDNYTRQSVRGASVGYSLSIVAVTLKGSAFFNSSTTVSWGYASSGCGQHRWIWGNESSYTVSQIVMASCTD